MAMPDLNNMVVTVPDSQKFSDAESKDIAYGLRNSYFTAHPLLLVKDAKAIIQYGQTTEYQTYTGTVWAVDLPLAFAPLGSTGGGSGPTGPDVTTGNTKGFVYIKGDAITEGSVRQLINDTGNYELQFLNLGEWRIKQKTDLDGTELLGKVTTGLGSFHLGEQHSMTSGGENVLFRNESKGIDFFAVWQGIKGDGSEVYDPTYREYSPIRFDEDFAKATSGSMDAKLTRTIPVNSSFFAATMQAEEDYTGPILYTIKDAATGTETFSKLVENMVVVAGQEIIVETTSPYEVQKGDAIIISTQKGRYPNSPYLQVRKSINPLVPWRVVKYRQYTDVLLKSGDRKRTFNVENHQLVMQLGLNTKWKITTNSAKIGDSVGFTVAESSDLIGQVQLVSYTPETDNEIFVDTFNIPGNYKYLAYNKNGPDPVTFTLEVL